MAIEQNILLTVDAVVICNHNSTDYILLIERKNQPFQSSWALPGGFVEDEEDLVTACARELSEETGLNISTEEFTQIGAFGKPGRDPRGRTVTIAFKCKLSEELPAISGADDAAKAKWWKLKNLPELAFDHSDIIKEAI